MQGFVETYGEEIDNLDVYELLESYGCLLYTSRYFMDTVRTVNDNDRTKCSIWYIVWKQGSTFPSIYLMWTFDV